MVQHAVDKNVTPTHVLTRTTTENDDDYNGDADRTDGVEHDDKHRYCTHRRRSHFLLWGKGRAGKEVESVQVAVSPPQKVNHRLCGKDLIWGTFGRDISCAIS